MKRYSIRFLLTALAMALLAQAAVAQSSAKPSPYEGVSEPPASDAIVASPDTPAAAASPRPAPSPAPARATAPDAQPSSLQKAATPPDPDADIVTEVPQSAVTATAPAHIGEPTLYERSTNPDADIVHVQPDRPGELDSGTLIHVRLQESLSTSETSQGVPFTAIVMAPVAQAGKVIIPMGSEVKGRVVTVRAGSRLGGKATLRLRPDVVTLPDGSRYMLHAQVVQTQGTDTRADNEGGITPKSHLKQDAIEYGAAAGTGAIVGAKFAGGTGALVGSAIGASIITAHLLLQNHQARLPKDSVLIFGLTEPMTLVSVQN